ncbi:hypothetical protein [Nocardia sp. NPDC052566]|uniref:hypothetical protein n=1 Tax=Nocardia sp. NPDC052566 TaxID=3364330 RepID=UPI0037CC71DC
MILAEPELALRTAIVFVRVPDTNDWYAGVFAGAAIRLRRNTMPGDNPYSLWLGGGRLLELLALPAAWTVDSGRCGGPRVYVRPADRPRIRLSCNKTR